MNKVQLSGVGSVVFWTDFIKSEYRRSDGETNFSQSNTNTQGYCSRTIGMCRRESGWIISVALSKDAPSAKTDKSGKGVVTHRIKKLIEAGLSTTAEDKGITWVPYSYLDYLYNDKATYNNIYGPIDPSYLKMAIKMLDGVQITS